MLNVLHTIARKMISTNLVTFACYYKDTDLDNEITVG